MKKWWLVFLVIILFSSFVVYSQTKPSCDPPAPFWSPRPTTTQGYVNAICGGGDACYQAWCNYFRPSPGNYQHLDEIPTSYYTQTYTQTSCTGTCKTNICSSYSSCSSATGTCTSGNCCTGSCTTLTTETANTEELKTVLINAIKDYFSSQTPKLTVNELKDLIVAYLQTSGSTAGLSGTGKYSGQKLIDVYNKAKGTTCIPNCAGKCGGVSDGCGGTCNAPCASGPVGSKTNPIPMNVFYEGRSLIYYPSTATRGAVTGLAPNSKTYFVVDSLAVTGKSIGTFYFTVKGFNNADLVYTIVPQSKFTGQDLESESRIKYGVYDAYDVVVDMKPYELDNTKFLYAIENRGPSFDIDVWVQFMPHVVKGLPAPSGPLGSKTNPYKLIHPTPRVLNGYISKPYSPTWYGPNPVTLPAYGKIYFEVDTLEATGKSCRSFGIDALFWNQQFANWKCLQSKETGAYSTEVRLGPSTSTGLRNIVEDGKPDKTNNYIIAELNKYKYLYAIEDVQGVARIVDVYVTINPYQQDEVAPTPVPAPTPLPQPSGALGSKTNPIKINKATNKILGGYIPSTSPDNGRGTINLPANTKLYFEVDPFVTTGRSVAWFAATAKFYNMAFSVCESVQNKGTGDYSAEVCSVPGGFGDLVYDNLPNEIDNYRFLYGIDNSATSYNFSIDIWATIP